MDFIKDLTDFAQKELDELKIDNTDAQDPRTTIERWIGVRLKTIAVIPYSVEFSSKIVEADLTEDQQRALDGIIEKCRVGEDINSHQGKGLLKPDVTDYLLADWGIHHLHLSTKRDSRDPRFSARSDKLLFAMFNRDRAFLIDIRPHGENYVFAQKELLTILHNEAPDLIESYSLKGIFDISDVIDDPETIEAMRKAGIEVIQKVDDTVYAPMGGGLTTAATPGILTLEVDRLYRRIHYAEDWVTRNIDTMRANFRSATGKECDELDLHLRLTDKGLYIMDDSSGCLFALDQIA